MSGNSATMLASIRIIVISATICAVCVLWIPGTVHTYMILYGRAAERYPAPALEGEDRLGSGGEGVSDRVSFVQHNCTPHLQVEQEEGIVRSIG